MSYLGRNPSAYSNYSVKRYLAGTDFTAGTTTVLTLPEDPGPGNGVLVFIDGVYQESSEFLVQGTSLTFYSAIPSGTTAVEVRYVKGLNIGVPSDASVNTAKLATSSVTPAKIVGNNSPTVGQIFVYNTNDFIWTDYNRDPLNVNPNMLFDQNTEGNLYSSISGTGVNGIDGWTLSGNGAGIFKMRRVADPDNAARYAMEITCTTADSSLDSSDNYAIYTSIEGYDLAQLAPGTSSAGKITAMFQFKTNVTGIYGVAIWNASTARSYVTTINVTDTNVNNYAVTIPLDTTGTWNYTNGIGCYFAITLAIGNPSSAAGTADTWQNGQKFSTTAQANFMSNISNIAYLGRVHIIPGNTVMAYKPADIERELAKAHRYYQRLSRIVGRVNTSTQAEVMVPFNVTKRSGPIMTLLDSSFTQITEAGVNVRTVTSIVSASTTVDGAYLVLGVSGGGMTPGNMVISYGANSLWIAANSRLT
jgi:hypothetical protein